jgi:DNA-binding CsgD family transcriptional regulator
MQKPVSCPSPRNHAARLSAKSRNSVRQEALFLISLASARRRVQPDTLTIGRLVVPHLTRARKRLDLRTAVARLTNRERVVADWLLKGKSNREIAGILDISEHTVKFHLARLFDQLSVSNRQSAVAVLLAERLL